MMQRLAMVAAASGRGAGLATRSSVLRSSVAWKPATSVGLRGLAEQASTFLDPKEVEERVIGVLQGFEKVDKAKVGPTAHFINDLGLDSLDAVEVVMAIEEEFILEIPDDMAEKILTVADAVKFVSEHPQAK